MKLTSLASFSMIGIASVIGSALAADAGNSQDNSVAPPSSLLALNLTGGTDDIGGMAPYDYRAAAGGGSHEVETAAPITPISREDLYRLGIDGFDGMLKISPTAYLGMQDKVNSSLQELNIYRPSRDANFYGGGINGGVRVTDFITPIPFSAPDLVRQDTWLFAGYNAGAANFRSDSNGFTVNPSDRFIFAGPLGNNIYSSGAPFSVTALNYRNDVRTQMGYVKVAQTCTHTNYSLTGFAGATYLHQTEREQFGFQIPTFSTDVLYTSPLRANTWGAELGVRLDVPLTKSLGPRFSSEGHLIGSYNFTTARGMDMIDVFNGSPNIQAVDVKKSNSAFGYDLGVGLNYALSSNATIGLGADYLSQGTYPRIVRDYGGGEPSRISFGNESAFIGTLRANITF